jgi:hypothetical protein
MYDYQFDANGDLIRNAKPWAPTWLRRHLGDEYFQEVRNVDLKSPTAVTLAAVQGLPQVRALSIVDSSRSAGGLVHLRAMTSLREIYLHGTEPLGFGSDLTDADLANLAGLPNLEGLYLRQTRVTDAGLVGLTALPSLSHLSIERAAGVTDRGVIHALTTFPNLSALDLGRTGVTDAALVHLRRKPRFKSLRIQGGIEAGRVTDAGLAELEGQHDLELLWLNGQPITDAGLVHLRGMKKLQNLQLNGTSITDAGLTNLAGLPELEMMR